MWWVLITLIFRVSLACQQHLDCMDCLETDECSFFVLANGKGQCQRANKKIKGVIFKAVRNSKCSTAKEFLIPSYFERDQMKAKNESETNKLSSGTSNIWGDEEGATLPPLGSSSWPGEKSEVLIPSEDSDTFAEEHGRKYGIPFIHTLTPHQHPIPTIENGNESENISNGTTYATASPSPAPPWPGDNIELIIPEIEKDLDILAEEEKRIIAILSTPRPKQSHAIDMENDRDFRNTTKYATTLTPPASSSWPGEKRTNSLLSTPSPKPFPTIKNKEASQKEKSQTGKFSSGPSELQGEAVQGNIPTSSSPEPSSWPDWGKYHSMVPAATVDIVDEGNNNSLTTSSTTASSITTAVSSISSTTASSISSTTAVSSISSTTASSITIAVSSISSTTSPMLQLHDDNPGEILTHELKSKHPFLSDKPIIAIVCISAVILVTCSGFALLIFKQCPTKQTNIPSTEVLEMEEIAREIIDIQTENVCDMIL